MPKDREGKQALVFIAMTLALSYGVFWGPLAFFQIPTISFVRSTTGPIWAVALFILGGFVPSLVGVLLTWKQKGADGLRRLGRRLVEFDIGRRWYLAAIAVVAFLTLGKLSILSLLGETFEPALFLTQAASLLPLLVLGPLSEELGWRGYALDRLQKNHGALTAALIVGLAWGLWHGPLFAMGGTSQHELAVPFVGFVAGMMLQSVLYTWLHNNTGGSLWTAIFFHWASTYAMQVVSSGATRSALYDGLENVPLLILAAAVVLWWGPRTLRGNPGSAAAQVQ